MISLSEHILGKMPETLKLKPASVKSSRTAVKRINRDELEAIYITDALVNNAINFSVNLFDCDFEVKAVSPKIKEETEDFLKQIDFPQLRKEIIKNCFIYGDGWAELIYGEGRKLKGAININSKGMDYRKKTGNIDIIDLDRYGRPVGYIQRISWEQSMEPTVNTRVINIGGVRGLPLRLDQAARFYLDTVGDGWYGIGLIEPIYSVTLGKNEAEAGLAHVINKVGFPILVNKVGLPDHEPTADEIKYGAQLIQDLNYKTGIAIPYYMDIQSLQITRIEKLKEFLQYFIDQQITGLSVPYPIATGRGGDTNRSTLVTQIKMFAKVNDERRKTFANQFTSRVLYVLAKSRGWSEIPQLTPPPTDVDSILEDVKKDKGKEVG